MLYDAQDVQAGAPLEDELRSLLEAAFLHVDVGGGLRALGIVSVSLFRHVGIHGRRIHGGRNESFQE